MKIHVNAKDRTHHFEAAAGEKILLAGLRHAVALPYECGSGTCGTCKARLVAGQLHDAWPEAPGRGHLKHPDEYLLCQCEAHGDVTLDLGRPVQQMSTGACVPGAIGARIDAVRRLTHDVMHLQVALEQAMQFEAGQFALIRVPGVAGFRGWSMVNYSRRAATLEFVIKKKPGGAVSEWLFNQRVEGTGIELYGPLGHATFEPGMAKNLLCIAGGSGIAGMMSILACAARAEYFTQYRGDVFFGVRTLRDAFFLEEFCELRTRCGEQLRVTIALSDEEVPAAVHAQYPQLQFDRGWVHEVAARHMQGRYENVRAYLAGPPPAVDAALRVLLLQARLAAENIRYDKFS